MAFGCEKDDKNVECPIIYELPTLYMGCTLENGETMIIKDQETLEKVFDKEVITQSAVLKSIDFTKYDVLVGCSAFNRGISELRHTLTKTGASAWLYKLTVVYDLTLPAGLFYYGIVVDKLPTGASVKVEVLKVND